MTLFRLIEFEPDRHITLVSRTWMFGEVAVTYAVRGRPGDNSRLVVKLAMRATGWPSRLLKPVLPAGDLVMMRKQLLTLKQLAEGTRADPGDR